MSDFALPFQPPLPGARLARHPKWAFLLRQVHDGLRRTLRRLESEAAITIRQIITLPNAALRRLSDPVGRATPEVRRLVGDMLETMYDAPGAGLAAIQIGVPLRVVTLDVWKGDERDPLILVDPEIIWSSPERRAHEEGCLSIPEFYGEVERPDRVRVRYSTLEGEVFERKVEGLLATCLQHEIDHLNGVLFIDRLVAGS